MYLQVWNNYKVKLQNVHHIANLKLDMYISLGQRKKREEIH